MLGPPRTCGDVMATLGRIQVPKAGNGGFCLEALVTTDVTALAAWCPCQARSCVSPRRLAVYSAADSPPSGVGRRKAKALRLPTVLLVDTFGR